MSELNWNSFLRKAGAAAQAASAVARSAAHTARLTLAIDGEEERIKASCQAIGKQYILDRNAGVSPDGPFYDEQIDRIREANARIRELRRERAASEPQPAPSPVSEENAGTIVLPDSLPE